MSDLAVTAQRLLDKFGESVTFTAFGTPAFNPITGEAQTGEAGSSYDVKAYPAKYESTDIDGTNIQQNDIRLITAIFTERPQKGWSVTVDGVTYQVMNVQTVRKTGRDVLTINQIRAN